MTRMARTFSPPIPPIPRMFGPSASSAAKCLPPPEIDIIRQFILVGRRIVREMRCELLTDFFDASDEAAREIPFTEFFRNHRHYPMPKILPHALMNPAIAENHELSTRGHYKEKHAVAVFCAGHAH